MMNKLRITAVQMNIVWENIAANMHKVKQWVAMYSKKSDVIIFPEMFLTGFSMNAKKFALLSNDKHLIQLKQWAVDYQISIAGSIMTEENGKYFNRFYYFSNQGEVTTYNKRHLFRMANEHHHYSFGNEQVFIREKDFYLMPAICYDLRFPVWLRNKNKYDVLIIVANWPHVRLEAWKKLLMARAIENQTYVIGVNCFGKDGSGIEYSGGTMIIDYKGNIMESAEENKEVCISSELDLQALNNFRKEFPAYLDADDFNIIF